MSKNIITYQFLDMNLLKSLVKNNDHTSLLNYMYNLKSKSNKIPSNKEIEFEKELRICQKFIANYVLSLDDEKLVQDLTYSLLYNNTDFNPDIYEKLCAKLINNKTPEEAMVIYKEITKHFFFVPSHTILNYISTNTKKADTCLFFINDLEQSYKKHGNDEYDKHILNFYERFRAVCSKEEFEQFIESGMQDENNLQKQ